MSSQAGRPSEHVARVRRKDAVPGRDVPRPQPGPSDAVLGATGPLTIPGPGEQYARPQPDRPLLHGAADAVQGAPLAPPPDGAREGLALGVDSAGGYMVPKELDSRPRRPHRRP
jgi:hypothetical protein